MEFLKFIHMVKNLKYQVFINAVCSFMWLQTKIDFFTHNLQEALIFASFWIIRLSTNWLNSAEGMTDNKKSEKTSVYKCLYPVISISLETHVFFQNPLIFIIFSWLSTGWYFINLCCVFYKHLKKYVTKKRKLKKLYMLNINFIITNLIIGNINYIFCTVLIQNIRF